MSMLKDVRLILIIALAFLCLIALKLCSSAYDSGTSVGGTIGQSQENAEQSVVAGSTIEVDDVEIESDETGESSATKQEEGENLVAASADKIEESTQAEVKSVAEDSGSGVEESNEISKDPQPGVTDSLVKEETAAGTEETVIGDTAATDKTEADASNGVVVEEPTTADAENPSDSDVESVSSAETETPIATSGATDASTVSALSALNIPPQADIIAIEKIILKEKFETGGLLSDFNADIQTVRDGLDSYSQKLETARGLFEKVTGGRK